MEEPRAVLVRSIKTFEELVSSVEDWQNGKDKPIPPKSELPDCIKKRVAWVRNNCMVIDDINFIDCLQIALPGPLEENKLKEKYQDFWLPMGDDYKQYCLHFYAPLLNILGQAVAVALIYGLNDDSEEDEK